MIKVTDKNKIIVEEPNDSSAAARCAVLVHGLAKDFDKKDPKFALAFLRAIYSMVDSIAGEIVLREDAKFDSMLEDKLKAKFGDDYKEKLKDIGPDDWKKIKKQMDDEDKELEKEETEDGNTERSDTNTNNSTNASEFDSIKEDKSAIDS